MNEKEIIKHSIESLKKAGAKKAQSVLQFKEINEFNVVSGKINFLRTTFDTNLVLTAILNNKKGSIGINKVDKNSIDRTALQVVELAKATEADLANDISEKQGAKIFYSGLEKPELNLMYDRLKSFLRYSKKNYPKTILREIYFSFARSENYFQNSNEVDFVSKKGIYNFDIGFSSKDKNKSSSMNDTGFLSKNLNKELKDFGYIDTLLKQSQEQINTKIFPEKIIGDVIITPDCLGDFIGYITSFLSDYSLITNTSIFKDKLNQSIANEKFTLYSKPISEQIADNYFITGDGFEAKNSVIIKKGILKTFLLSLYGSKKTGKARAINSGGAYIVEPGDKSFQDLVKSVKKGILLSRFSGGAPSDNGDFSGVAKNSYYIENGKIKYPLSETMISGNLVEMLENIKNISKERINFGDAIFPWILFKGLVISGK
jgi:PmbA protein